MILAMAASAVVEVVAAAGVECRNELAATGSSSWKAELTGRSGVARY